MSAGPKRLGNAQGIGGARCVPVDVLPDSVEVRIGVTWIGDVHESNGFKRDDLWKRELTESCGTGTATAGEWRPR